MYNDGIYDVLLSDKAYLLIIAISINSKGCESTYVERLCLLKKKV